MWAQPDVLGVWGEQSAEHAVKIQGINSSQIRPIGTPRFEIYSQHKPSGHATETFRRENPFFVFAGCAIPFDEISALVKLDTEISENQETFGGLRIVYRPHPHRQRRSREDVFDESRFSSTISDQLFKEEMRETLRMPDEAYLSFLLQMSLGMIAPLTTMIIEALICDKPVLALTYHDSIHITSPSEAVLNYEHFRDLDKLKNLSLTKSEANLGNDLRAFYQQSKEVRTGAPNSHLRYILHHDSMSYSHRLDELVTWALSNKT
jgi:CDP-glycerol glycerophosphotransferase (TagB/SpsB family)